MASITAPVAGSWGDPAWTAKVPNLWTGEGALGGVSTGAPSLAVMLRYVEKREKTWEKKKGKRRID